MTILDEVVPVAPAERRQRRLDLAEQLIVEYAGAVAPGRVLATVLRADHLLRRSGAASAGSEGLFESLVRHQLVEYAARGGTGPRS